MTIISVQNLLGKCHVIKFLHVIKFWRPLYFLQAGCCCRLHLAAQRLSSRHKSHARQVILMCQKDVKLVEAREVRGRSWLYCIREIRIRVQKRSPSYWFASTYRILLDFQNDQCWGPVTFCCGSGTSD
jgi:hypothetical protein